ncbi:MAG: methyltransferase domain-containing protein [Bacteroidales bacterium]|nr:methyltransferase domain-containing protein [Bacteroidales bacterium]
MEKHLCPYWVGYFLINPLRKFRHDPERILGDYLKSGMQVIDYGCAMGYFSLPMAKMVGESGKVYCFDVQKKMLNRLRQRAKKAGVSRIVEPLLIENDTRVNHDMNVMADFTLLFAVAHEVTDKELLFRNLNSMMKSKGLLLFAEPSGYVFPGEFKESVSIADNMGFRPLYPLKIKSSHSMLLEKR